MTSAAQLAIAYIAKSPESASRVLSSMPPEAAAAFIEEIPIPHAVNLVGHLQPAIAAEIVQTVDDKVARAIMRDLDFGSSSAIVRQMDRPSRRRFLAKLSTRTRTMLEKSLSFARGTVGSRMTATIATLSEKDSVATALDTLRQFRRDPIDVIFVLNEARQLIGVVSSAIALRHPEEALVSAILDTSCPQVSAHSKLEAIADPALWQDFSYLPVVNRQREVIGAFSRKALRHGMLASMPGANEADPSTAASILAALATTSAGLLDLATALFAGSETRGERNGY
jgi:magnesium transporter